MSDTIPKVDNTGLLDAFEKQLRDSKAESTVESYVRHARDYLHWVEETDEISLFDVRPGEIKDHLREIDREGYSPSYIGLRRSAIRALYSEAADIAGSRTSPGLDDVDPDDLPDNPAHPDELTVDFNHGGRTLQEQETKQDYVAVDEEDVEAMLANVPPSHVGGKDHRLIIKLLWDTGLRVSEAVRIKLSDFENPDTFRGDQDERAIRVRAVKTQSNRTVYYGPELAEDLDDWVNGTDRDFILGEYDSQYLFPSPNISEDDEDEHIHERQVNHVVREAAKGAGIQERMYEDQNGNTRWRYTAHSLRHGMAEACLEQGMNLRTLAELMGHEDKEGRPNVDTTVMYLQGIDTGEQYRKHSPPTVRARE